MSNIEAFSPRRWSWPEVFRVLVLASAVLLLLSPFLTSREYGGIDARWYAYMIGGVTEPINSGHFPTPAGQGPFAWNGGVHPFRSAPVYLMVAAAWDVVTLGRLTPFLLQHLVVVTSGMVGTLGFYAAAVKLMPERRWWAVAVAILYLSAPSWLAIPYKIEAYMSYMAFAAMPLVLYGNARTVMRADGRGYITLGAGLALIWMCHPPIAFLTSLTTLFIQMGCLITRGLVAWRGILKGALTFAVLAAYYFASMSEVGRVRDGDAMSGGMPGILAAALFFICIGRGISRSRGPDFKWLAGAVPCAWLVARTSGPWFQWITAAAVLWTLVVLVLRRFGGPKSEENDALILLACGIVAAAAVQARLGEANASLFRPALNVMDVNTGSLREYLSPLTQSVDGNGIVQLGWGLDALLVAGALCLLGRRPLAMKLFFAACLLLLIGFMRLPLASNFLVGYFPIGISAMVGVPLGIRMMPVIASFVAMSGVLLLASVSPAASWRRAVSAALLLSAAWCIWQGTTFVRAGHALTAPAEGTEMNLRSENIVLDRYVYDLVHIPDYFTNGESDPLLETRLVDDSGNVLIGPTDAARIEEAQGVRHVRLTCRPIDNAPAWVDITPQIEVLPGEHLLLRFAFDSTRGYNGYLLMKSEHGYREYHLPNSGQDLAFGAGGTRSPVLSLWNSGSTSEHYSLSETLQPGNTLVRDGGLFANLSVSHFDPSALPIRLEALIPYRVRVSSASGGWLESFRVFLPGYRAWVDGSPAPAVASRQSLVEVRVPPGIHEVEIRFVGTPRLWIAGWVSAIAWIALAGIALAHAILPRRFI